ncbi:hypothetical protein QL285_072422 [Trifolium repens]|nr:hypothetical protein QL285_072422 [Trifolium repens]
MAMPVDSNSSPLALRKDHDSDENEKDFDKPIKKLKVDRDLAGEEDNTDSVPKVENEKDFAKLKDLAGEEEDNTDSVPPKVASLTEQEREGKLYELYQRFKKYYQKKYDQEEDVRKFRVFKQNLERPQPTQTHTEFAVNRPGFADLTPDEYDCFQPRIPFSKQSQQYCLEKPDAAVWGTGNQVEHEHNLIIYTNTIIVLERA